MQKSQTRKLQPVRPSILSGTGEMKMLKVFFLFFLLFSGSVFAQTELNVRVAGNRTDLIRELHQVAEIGMESWQKSNPNAKEQFSWLSRVKEIKPLAKESNKTLNNLFTLRFEENSAQSKINQLKSTGVFEFVEENRSRKIHHTPMATVIGTLQPQTQVSDPDLSLQYYHSLIGTFEAWDSTPGSPSVVIGILDTGLDYDHPEFLGQLAISPLEDLNSNGSFEPWPDSVFIGGLSGDMDGLDNDGNGYPDDVIGFDFTDQPRSPFGGDFLFDDGDPFDENAHGTIVAGIISARADNDLGGAGIAPGCKIRVLRAFAANGSGEDDDISRAIIYAADNGIQILNFSFGDVYPSQMMQEAIKYAHSKGMVMVGSAGNGTGDDLHYPSNYPEVISVSASAWDSATGDEYLWPISSFGLNVDLAAPGSGIYTTTPLDTAGVPQFGFFSGTSTSAPMVTSAVALLFSQRGACSSQQIRGLLTTSADDISLEGWDHYTGAGRLNIGKAMRVIGASHVEVTGPKDDEGTAGLAGANILPVTGTVVHPQFREYALEYAPGTESPDSWISIITGQNLQIREDTLGLWDISTLPEGEYTLRLRVDLSNGRTAEDRIRFVKDSSAPVVKVLLSNPVWDNEAKSHLIVYRSSDFGQGRLFFKPLAAAAWLQLTFDRKTKNGDFLLGNELLQAGAYEYFIELTNAGGLSGTSPVDTFVFNPEFLSQTGYNALDYKIPFGAFLPNAYDLNANGQQEIIMSEYGGNLSFGKQRIYEFSGGGFNQVHESGFKPVLIPKDVADTDNDGLWELLCSVNDSLFLLEQASPGAWPDQLIYSNLGNSFYAAKLADTDNDGSPELLTKNFEDYFIFEKVGGEYVQSATLEDVTAGYVGSLAPRVLVDDFDGDAKPEIIFGDYDGDFIVFEHAGGNNYNPVFVDSTYLEKAGELLTKGDFDGDGQPEFFVATHSALLRNDDFEYDTPYWWLRIFKASADNTYQVVWEDYFYDLDTDGFNAATAGNLDSDAADELVFSTYPRTYLIDFEAGNYHLDWFQYGALQTHHVIGDFNGNGISEFSMGLTDSVWFFEKDLNYAGPTSTPLLRGQVTGPNSTRLEWAPSPNSTEYLIWRGPYIPGNTTVFLIDSSSSTFYQDAGLQSETEYLYVVLSKNPGLVPAYGQEFSNPVYLTPHNLNRADTAFSLSQNQLKVNFSEKVRAKESDKSRFLLNGQYYPFSINDGGTNGKHLIVSFTEGFQVGSNTLLIDTNFRDVRTGPLDPGTALQIFEYQPQPEDFMFLTWWTARDEKTAELWFDRPTSASALNPENYIVRPHGRITGVSFVNGDPGRVQISLENAVLGALGNPISITVVTVLGVDGVAIHPKEGNTATFSENKPNLNEVYVYPNPVLLNQTFEGLRFANLTRRAIVYIYNANGRKVNVLGETDGDGGITWDMNDQGGNKIKPGVYLFRVVSPDVEEDFLGKFGVVE